MKPIGQSSYAGTYLDDRKKTGNILPLVMLVIAAMLPLIYTGSAAVLCAIIGSTLALMYGNMQLGGMSGDVSGYAITIGEACGVLAMVMQSIF